MNLNKAINQIVDHVAKTGKPYADVVDSMWDKINLDPDELKQIVKYSVTHSSFAGRSVRSEIAARIAKYKKSPVRWKSDPSRGIFVYDDIKTCTSEEAQRLILTLQKASWGHKRHTLRKKKMDEPSQIEIVQPKVKQIIWKDFTDEQILRICTTAEKAGIHCYVDSYNRYLFIFAPIEFYLQHANLPVQEMHSNNFKRYESLIKRRMLKKVNAKLGR
jgi:hypothetical protein